MAEFKTKEEYEQWKKDKLKETEEKKQRLEDQRIEEEEEKRRKLEIGKKNISLINCPTCSKAISVNAAACPKCGEPLTEESKTKAIEKAVFEPVESEDEDEAKYTKVAKEPEKEKSTASPFALSCLVVSIIGFWTPVIFVNFIVVVAVVLGIISVSRKENGRLLAIIGILIAFYCFRAASDQMEQAQSKLRDAQYELERLQE